VADRHADFLLIGGGVAAAHCARALDGHGSVLMVCREKDPPYERPPLSKSYLAGQSSRVDAELLPGGLDVEVLTRVSVMKLDTEARLAKLSTKEEVEFGSALIATGAMVRRLKADGSDLDGIHYLRTFGNADAIRSDALEAGRVVLIGGSYIGCELAATLTGLGVSCSLLMQEDVVLERVLGRAVGEWVQRRLVEHGVEVHGGDSLGRFEGSDGRVERVVSEGGVVLEGGCVAIGCGVVPDVMLARSAGLELGPLGGVACTAGLETSAPGVYAAGDVAEWESALHGGTARVEHFEVAAGHGRVAAANMMGSSSAYEQVPYFWSDLGDWATIEYVGVGIGSGEPVVRGSLDGDSFTAFYLDGARVVGAATVGRSGDLDEARELIAARAEPAREALARDA
jgi:3-phenylpropionate/trans-cinnamate dioxygenase ferredoxin reductase subunit